LNAVNVVVDTQLKFRFFFLKHVKNDKQREKGKRRLFDREEVWR